MKKSGIVVLVGRPNAGKSTLLNQLIGTKVAIVTPKIQTTRFQTRGILNAEAGQIVFVDTPGIHKAKEGGLNAGMLKEVDIALDSPDLVWYLVDPHSTLTHEEEPLKTLAHVKAPIFVLWNKADEMQPDLRFKLGVEQRLREQHQKVVSFDISALKADGVSALVEASWAELPEGQPLYDPASEEVTDRPMRFLAGELVREEVFLQFRQEIPYSCAVWVDKYEADSKIHRIHAVIAVERDSQKGMIIGKGGASLKQIGIAARQKIEAMTGVQIFLALKVKVIPNWTKDPAVLRKLGFSV